MGNLNEFRLSQETAFLFVLSYEYNIPFPKLLGMYNISEKMFWAYMSLFAPMSKMGVRKGGQLSKMANRIYKSIRGIKERIQVKVDVDIVDEDGNLVYDDKGEVLKEKQTKVETVTIVLTDEEQKIRDVMDYYITNGFSNGDIFYSTEDIMDRRLSLLQRDNSIKIDGELYTGCTQIEHIIEKYFPEMTTAQYRELSVQDIGEMLTTLRDTELAIHETKS